jgi:hypothetical protein
MLLRGRVIHSYTAKLERVFHPRSFVIRDGYGWYPKVERDIRRHVGDPTHTREDYATLARSIRGCFSRTRTACPLHGRRDASEILQYVIVRLERVS